MSIIFEQVKKIHDEKMAVAKANDSSEKAAAPVWKVLADKLWSKIRVHLEELHGKDGFYVKFGEREAKIWIARKNKQWWQRKYIFATRVVAGGFAQASSCCVSGKKEWIPLAEVSCYSWDYHSTDARVYNLEQIDQQTTVFIERLARHLQASYAKAQA